MPYSETPAQNPVPEQSQAAFVPSPMNQYPADPSAVQPVDPNMGMNAVAKTNIPESTQVRIQVRVGLTSSAWGDMAINYGAVFNWSVVNPEPNQLLSPELNYSANLKPF